jgi:Tfp pilus assembly protein PilF
MDGLLGGRPDCGCSNSEEAKKAYFEKGEQFLKDGKYQEAIVELRNAVQQDEKFGGSTSQARRRVPGVNNPQAAFREAVRAADLLAPEQRGPDQGGDLAPAEP